MGFLLQNMVLKSFLFLSSLFDDVHFQYSEVLLNFLLSKSSDTFLIWQLYSFYCFSFPPFIISIADFWIPNSIFISFKLNMLSFWVQSHLLSWKFNIYVFLYLYFYCLDLISFPYSLTRTRVYGRELIFFFLINVSKF